MCASWSFTPHPSPAMVTRTLSRFTLAACAASVFATALLAQAPTFEVTVDPATRAAPLTGRLIVVVSKTAQQEPRMLIAPQGPAMFAIDVEQLRAGQPALVDTKSALGYPVPLASLPPGDYYAQAIVNVYEHVKRADGKTLWLHMTDGTQEVMQIAEGAEQALAGAAGRLDVLGGDSDPLREARQARGAGGGGR